MAAGGTAVSGGGEEASHLRGLTVHRLEAARQSRALTAALGGTSVAIFTFLLFFLYPRYVAGEVDATLFQLTLLAILVCVYLLVFASWFFFLFTETLGVEEERPMRYLDRANACFAVAVIILTVTPTLVLFTVNLLALGLTGLMMWLIYLGFFLREFPLLSGKRHDRASAR